MISGLNKAWIGINNAILELPSSDTDDESYDYELLGTSTFTLSTSTITYPSNGIKTTTQSALLPNLTAAQYTSLKRLKVEVTPTSLWFSVYSQHDSSTTGWIVNLDYMYSLTINSSGIDTTFIKVPIMASYITFPSSSQSYDFTPSVSTAYSPVSYINNYKVVPGADFSEYINSIGVTSYGRNYTGSKFFNDLKYTYATYQYCTHTIILYASNAGSTYYSSNTSTLSLKRDLNITVKIY